MARQVGPEMMREFLASGNINSNKGEVSQVLAAGLLESDPEFTQVVMAAALCYTSKNFDDFAKNIGLDATGKALVKMWLNSSALLTTNGAHVMRDMREAFSE